ncbi:hypothetical protein WH47_09264, partial [Habropoda laboriosa]
VHQKLKTQQPSLVNRKGPNLSRDYSRPPIVSTIVEKLHQPGIEVLISSTIFPRDSNFCTHGINVLATRQQKHIEHYRNYFQ